MTEFLWVIELIWVMVDSFQVVLSASDPSGPRHRCISMLKVAREIEGEKEIEVKREIGVGEEGLYVDDSQCHR